MVVSEEAVRSAVSTAADRATDLHARTRHDESRNATVGRLTRRPLA